MATYLLVLPVIVPDLAVSCMESMTGIDRERVVVVDNVPGGFEQIPWTPGQVISEGRNLGVAASWNRVAGRVVRERHDFLILCSQAVVFFDPGGADLVAGLDTSDGWGIECAHAGWHLIGISRATLETVGPFDEGFWPAYYEDTDYLYRMGLHGLPSPRENGRHWPYVDVSHGDRGNALSIHYGGVRPEFGALTERYRAKWGGNQTEETFDRPWGTGQPTWWWHDTPYPLDDPWSGT